MFCKPPRIAQLTLLLCGVFAAGFFGGLAYEKWITVGYTKKLVGSWLGRGVDASPKYSPSGEFYRSQEIQIANPAITQLFDPDKIHARASSEIARLNAELPLQRAFWERGAVQARLAEIHEAAEARKPTEVQMQLQRFYPPLLPDLLIHPLPHTDITAICEKIVVFDHKLKAEGRHLLFIPLPNPVDLDLPLFLKERSYASAAFSDSEFFIELLQRGVDVVDLREPFAESALTGRNPFYRADHHWTAEGMDITVRAIADIFGSECPGLRIDDLRQRFARSPMMISEVHCNGDFAPTGMQLGDSLAYRVTFDGQPLRQSFQSPVLAIGDSNIVHLLGSGGDFTSQLAFELGQPLAFFGQMGGTKYVPRLYEELIRQSRISPRVVVWVAINGGWRDFGTKAVLTPVVAAEQSESGRLVGKYSVTVASKVPMPADAPYPDALYTFKVRAIGNQRPNEAIVVTWAFHNRKEIRDRKVERDAVLDLDLQDWESIRKRDTGLARLQQADDLDDFDLPRYFWPISLK